LTNFWLIAKLEYMHYLPVNKSLKESGQALLIILLVMSIVLTVVLSIIARSVTDIGISKYQDSSIRAFSAAEAGVERAIIGTVTSGTTYNMTEGGASFTPVITTMRSTVLPDGTYGFNYPTDLSAGESATFWLVSHIVDANGEEKITCQSGPTCPKPPWVKICWGENGTPINNNTPAIEVEFYYDRTTTGSPIWDTTPNNFSAINIARAASDPYQTRPVSSGFADVTPGGCQMLDKTYAFARRIFLNPGGGPNDEKLGIPNWPSLANGSFIMIRVRMFFNTDKAHPVGIITPQNPPAQGALIESTGVSVDSYRKLSFFQGYPELPFAFDSAIFSSGNISK
jgi:hypothetical protein